MRNLSNINPFWRSEWDVRLGWNNSFCDRYQFLRPTPNIPRIHIFSVSLCAYAMDAAGCKCLNQGQCDDKGKCICPKEFTGNKCQTGKYTWIFCYSAYGILKAYLHVDVASLTECVGFGPGAIANGLDCVGLVIISTLSESWQNEYCKTCYYNESQI